MERVHKYRVWDGETMHYPSEGKHIIFWDDPKRVKWAMYENHHHILVTKPDRGGVLLEYTGLTDKNGKEIYESDIVIITTLAENGLEPVNHDPVEVKWNDEAAGFSLGYVSNIMSLYLGYEVIGNVFETPELLTKD